MSKIPEDLRSPVLAGTRGDHHREGWAYAGSVKVDGTWTAYIGGGQFPALHKQQVVNAKRGGGRVQDTLPLYVSLDWTPGQYEAPSKITVRIVVPDFKFKINWRPPYGQRGDQTLASVKGYYPVTEIIPYEEGWEPNAER